MNEKENIFEKIKSKYTFNNIFEYIYKFSFKYSLIKYSKILQEKFEISKIEYQKISSIIKYKLISPEIFLENKNILIKNISEENKYTIKELINKIVISSYEKKLKNFLENNKLEYYIINNEKMIELLIENSIFINKSNLEINLNEKLINNNNFINYIEKIINSNLQIFLTFVKNDEEINEESFFKKLNDIKICNLSKIGINFPYFNNISFNNILEFSYNGNTSNEDFMIINKFINLTHLKLINNSKELEALINFKNLIYFSILNCPSSNIIIESEEITNNLKYFEFDDDEIIKFKFNNEPNKNKINFVNLEYLYFQYDIINFDKSNNIKKLKENKIELINTKMEFFLNLLLKCRKIEEIDLNVYQINKINKDRLNLFFEVFKSLSLKSLIISSAFEKEIVYDLIQSKNIAKSCKKLKLHINDLNILDFIINNYNNLEELEINIEEKIAKFRVNTPNEDTIKLLNDSLYKKYESFKKENNWVKIKQNQKGKIKKLILNNSNFQIIQQEIYCYSFSMLVELILKNIPIGVNTLPLFNKNTNIYFSSLKVLIIRIMSYVDSFYQLEFKRKTLINNLRGLKNPFNINMNMIEEEAIENFSNNINKIPNCEHLVLNFMLPGIKKDVIRNMLEKILELTFLVNLDFSITQTSEQKPLKLNQLKKIFPKLKKSKTLLPFKLNICSDI